MEPNVADLRYFKLWILLDQIIWVWNIKGLQHRVLKILRFENLILFQRINSFNYRTTFCLIAICQTFFITKFETKNHLLKGSCCQFSNLKVWFWKQKSSRQCFEKSKLKKSILIRENKQITTTLPLVKIKEIPITCLNKYIYQHNNE